MKRHCALALVLFFAPALCMAQDAPEDLLSSKTQIYVRWDGNSAHQKAYDKTAMGKIMQGDLGKFLDSAFVQLKETLGTVIAQEGLLDGKPPEQLEKMQKDINEAMKLLKVLGDRGILFAVEARGVTPPSGQVTIIVPDADKDGETLFSLFRLIASNAGIDLKPKKIGDHTVTGIEGVAPVNLGWWMHGKHAVVTVTTESLADTIKRMHDNKKDSLSKNKLFAGINNFKKYETSFRGYVDFASLRVMALETFPQAVPFVNALGLQGLKAVTFVSGFEDRADRGTLELHLEKERTGLLRLTQGTPFTMKDVPPLPKDVNSWQMMSVDFATFYDEALKMARAIINIVDPDRKEDLDEGLKQVKLALGVDLRKDLLAHLGDQVVSYSSPAEGLFGLGATTLVKVKDGKKIKETMETMVKNLSTTVGVEMITKKTMYRGVEVSQILVRQEGFIFVPTYAVHKDWLIVALFPQSVQGAILRLNGEIKGWEPNADLKDSLSKLPKEFTSISIVDPRPGVAQLLSIAPMAGGLLRTFVPEAKFDVGSIPNAHVVTKELFPNVTVSEDKDNIVRIESRSSIPMPFDLSGAGIFALFGAFGAIADK